MNNAVAFKCPECNANMKVDSIWMNKGFEFYLQAYCEPCQKSFDYSVTQLMACIIEEFGKNLVKGPSRAQ